jgi:hypothetical protein
MKEALYEKQVVSERPGEVVTAIASSWLVIHHRTASAAVQVLELE